MSPMVAVASDGTASAPRSLKSFVAGRAVGGGKQHGDISPDRRPALLDEFLQPSQGCGLIQADEDGQVG